jgi:hypothetical protein
MRARLVVWALCVAIAVSQVGTVCPNPPVANQSIGQFISAPRALVASDSDTQKLEETTRRLAGTNAVLAANPVRFAEGTRGRFRTAVAACIAQVAIASGNVDRQALCTPLTVNPTNLARTVHLSLRHSGQVLYVG